MRYSENIIQPLPGAGLTYDRYSPSILQEWSEGPVLKPPQYVGPSILNDDYFPETDTEDTPSDKTFDNGPFGYRSYSSYASSYHGDVTRQSTNSDGSSSSDTPRSSPHSGSQYGSQVHQAHQGPQQQAQIGANPNTQHSAQAFKCRQLPCRTFISTGSCPYGDRCVFLHDPSIVAKPVYIKTKRKSKEDVATDAFFWPTMSLSSVMGKTDSKQRKYAPSSL